MDEREIILYNDICLFTAGSIWLGDGRKSGMYRLAEIMKDPVFIAAALAVLVLFVVIILIVYSHKTNIQTRTLRSIDKHIADGVSMPAVPAASETAEAGMAEIAETAAVQDASADDASADMSIEELAAKAAEDARRAEELREEKAREKRSRMYNVGKSGKVYSKEELEALIKN